MDRSTGIHAISGLLRAALLAIAVAAGAASLQLLAQANPPAATLTPVFTATAPTTIAELWLTNRDSAAHSVRLSLAPGGVADDPSQYLYYSLPLPPNGSLIQAMNLPLSSGDVLRAWVDAQQVSISVFGTVNQP